MSVIGTINLHSNLSAPAVAPWEEKSLFERMGGVWGLAAVVLLLAVAVYFAGPLLTGPDAGDDLQFSASDSNGRMRVTWNRRSAVINGAQSGRLDVIDGPNVASYPVEASVLRAGTLEYIRHSPDVLLTLAMFRDGQIVHREMIRSIGVERESEPAAERTTRSRRR